MHNASPFGASGDGGMYATELTYRDPARKTVDGENGTLSDSRCHKIAVVSREAEMTRLSVGELKPRT